MLTRYLTATFPALTALILLMLLLAACAEGDPFGGDGDPERREATAEPRATDEPEAEGTPEATRQGILGRVAGRATEEPEAEATPEATRGSIQGLSGRATEEPEPTATRQSVLGLGGQATAEPEPMATSTSTDPLCPRAMRGIAASLDPSQTSPDTDREALMALFLATGGENWDYGDSWGSNEPVGDWSNVSTDENGRVTGLDLGGGRLSEIPPELGNLASLKSLNLAGKPVDRNTPGTGQPLQPGGAVPQRQPVERNTTGTVQPHQPGNLPSLEHLGLHGNQLSEIPPEMGNLSSLKWLRLSGNQLTEIPPGTGQPPQPGGAGPQRQPVARLPAGQSQPRRFDGISTGWNSILSLIVGPVQRWGAGINAMEFVPYSDEMTFRSLNTAVMEHVAPAWVNRVGDTVAG